MLADGLHSEQVPPSPSSLEQKPPLKSPHHAYCAAKAQCMQYLKALRASGQLPFSVAQVIPGTVIGPSEFCHTSTEAFAHLDRQSKALLFDENTPRYAFGFVHVTDCARVHVETLDETKVGNKDLPDWFIAAGTVEEGVDGDELWNAAADMVEHEFADQVSTGVFKVGRDRVPINIPFRADSRLTEKMLLAGERIRVFQDSVRDVAKWYLTFRKDEV